MSTKTPGSSNARPGGIFGAQRGGPQNVGQFKDPAGAAKRPASTKQPSMKSFFGGGGGGDGQAGARRRAQANGARALHERARRHHRERERERERAGWDREREQNDAAQSRMTVGGCKAETYTGSVYTDVSCAYVLYTRTGSVYASVPCTYRYVPYAEVLYAYRVRTVRVGRAVPVRTVLDGNEDTRHQVSISRRMG